MSEAAEELGRCAPSGGEETKHDLVQGADCELLQQLHLEAVLPLFFLRDCKTFGNVKVFSHVFHRWLGQKAASC